MKKTAIIIAAVAVSVSMLLAGMAFGSYEEDFQTAVKHYKAGRYEEAARILEDYVKDRPEGRAYYLLGYANYALDKQDEAAKNFHDAYLVDPEMNPQEFRKSIGIDTGIPPKPRVRKPAAAPEVKEPAKAAPVAPEAPAMKTPAPAAPEAPAPAKVEPTTPPPPSREAPAPRPRPRPRPAPKAEPAEPMLPPGLAIGAGLVPLAVGLVFYLYFAFCLFRIGKKTETSASWLAFIPVINSFWPTIGAAGKPAWWIILLLIPVVNIFVAIYLWMLITERLGKNKFLGLLMLVPVVNIVFLGLLAFKGQAVGAGGASMGLELPEFQDEFPELPEVPGMEGGEAEYEPAGAPEPEEEDIFGEGFGEEEPKEEFPAEEPEELEEAEPAEEGDEDIFELGEEEPEEELGVFEVAEEAEDAERAPSLEEMGFEEAEEATPEEIFDEEEPPENFLEGAPERAPEPQENIEAVTPEEAFERAAPREGAEPWEVPEEEPLETEASEEAPSLPPRVAGAGMMSIGDLFTVTWASFTKRVLPLLGLYVIAMIVTFLAAGIFVGIGALLASALEGMRQGIFIGTGLVAGIAGLIAFGWGYGAFIFAASDDNLDFGASLVKSWQRVGSFIWVFFLLNFIILGGFGLFLVPGVLFATWFSFALFVFVKEGEGGMNALLKSKEYVRGNFWGVFLRFFLVTIISVGISWVPFVGGILSLLYAPFMMLYIYNMYADLRAVKGEMSFSPGGGQKAFYVVLSLLGWIVIPIIFFLVAGAAMLGPYLMNMQMQFPAGP